MFLLEAVDPPPPSRDCRPPKRPKEWKEYLRQLLGILARQESDGCSGWGAALLDTDKSSAARQMTGVKAAALRVLRLVAVDEERVVELGCYTGFQVRDYGSKRAPKWLAVSYGVCRLGVACWCSIKR